SSRGRARTGGTSLVSGADAGTNGKNHRHGNRCRATPLATDSSASRRSSPAGTPDMKRREFLGLTACGMAAGAQLLLPRLNRSLADTAARGNGRFDVVIAGGGVGGVAAALSALRSGLKVAMTEETDWIGGQLTQQGVPPDEHEWI